MLPDLVGIQGICRTPYRTGTSIQDVSVDHCCAYIPVAQQFLHGTDVRPGLKQMGRKRMPQGMTARRLANSCRQNSPVYGALHRARVIVVPARWFDASSQLRSMIPARPATVVSLRQPDRKSLKEHREAAPVLLPW